MRILSLIAGLILCLLASPSSRAQSAVASYSAYVVPVPAQMVITPSIGTYVSSLGTGDIGINCNILPGTVIAAITFTGNYTPTSLSLTQPGSDLVVTTSSPWQIEVGSSGMTSSGMTCGSINSACHAGSAANCANLAVTVNSSP